MYLCRILNLNISLKVFLSSSRGFVHEGIQRRSVYCANEGARGAWKDVIYLALLETEWLMRSFLKPAPKSLWDEMFARHAKEREQLLRWDDKQQRLKRTASMETVRVLDTASEMTSLADETGDPAVTLASSSDTSSVHSGKKRKLRAGPLDRQSQASSPPPSDSEQSDASWDKESMESDGASDHLHYPLPGRVSWDTRDLAVRDADSLSNSSGSGGGSPSDMNWEMLETASVSTSSFESLSNFDEE